MAWPFSETSQAGDHCVKELTQSRFEGFVTNDDETHVTLFELRDGDAIFQKHVFRSASSLEAHLRPRSTSKFRIISIPQDNSNSPLQVTRVGMEQVLKSLPVSPDFVFVLSSMGRPPHEAEYGLGHIIENHHENGSFDIAYLSRYYGYREWKEDDQAELTRSWKSRHVGVYHAFNASQDAHTFILMHPESEGMFQESLERLVGGIEEAKNLHARPMMLHALLASTHFQNWRLFLQEKGERFQDSENLLAQDMKDIDVRFDRLQFWHDLEDRIAPLQAIFAALLGQFAALQRVDSFLNTSQVNSLAPTRSACFELLPANYFRSRENLVRGLMSSAEVLQKRIHAASRLLESTVELRNQAELRSINMNVYKLQRESIDDSETVTVLTILTMIYLPASLVSSFFGMNFFEFHDGSRKLIGASNWWLFPAVFLPLTAITMMIWRFVVWVMDLRRKLRAKKMDSDP